MNSEQTCVAPSSFSRLTCFHSCARCLPAQASRFLFKQSFTRQHRPRVWTHPTVWRNGVPVHRALAFSTKSKCPVIGLTKANLPRLRRNVAQRQDTMEASAKAIYWTVGVAWPLRIRAARTSGLAPAPLSPSFKLRLPAPSLPAGQLHSVARLLDSSVCGSWASLATKLWLCVLFRAFSDVRSADQGMARSERVDRAASILEPGT